MTAAAMDVTPKAPEIHAAAADPPRGGAAPVCWVGGCNGVAAIPLSEIEDFYRGNALAAIVAASLACLLAITVFVIQAIS